MTRSRFVMENIDAFNEKMCNTLQSQKYTPLIEHLQQQGFVVQSGFVIATKDAQMVSVYSGVDVTPSAIASFYEDLSSSRIYQFEACASILISYDNTPETFFDDNLKAKIRELVPTAKRILASCKPKEWTLEYEDFIRSAEIFALTEYIETAIYDADDYGLDDVDD